MPTKAFLENVEHYRERQRINAIEARKLAAAKKLKQEKEKQNAIQTHMDELWTSKSKK